MFQLQISDTDATSGSIPVSWCLDEETIKELADKKIANPQVVICVSPVNTEGGYHVKKEYRKVVPLKDLMTYVEFRSAGPNRIWGFISYMGRGASHTRYLGKKDGEFQTNILDWDGEQYAHFLLDFETYEARTSKVYKGLSQPIQVEVPAGVFAPEPAPWEKAWVNLFFKDKVVDQCEFRRRRLFAYSVQPLIMLVSLILRFLLLVAGAAMLARNFSFKWLLHPLMYSLDDCLEIFDNGCAVIFHQPEDSDRHRTGFFKPGYFIRSFWLLWLLPLLWAPPVLSAFLGRPKPAIMWVGTIGVIVATILLVSVLANYFQFLGVLFKPFGWVWDFITRERPMDELWYLDQKEMRLITCTQDRKPMNFKRLPSNHKTIRLRFQDLKSKVCRPFSL